ncbi:MAG TPA: lysylphosphatidylglycerol synthase transmembrane domain-containing protein [Gaiellaceae bacterium]|nr:lysylphosphatidylglycerol synthase transmembrane domain-containing protein [Gaiellaceae bacterium]
MNLDRVPGGRWRILIILPAAAAVVALLWWRGPKWSVVGNAFTAVEWRWVVAAIGLNLLSVVARAVAWSTVIRSAIAPPAPRFPLVFSAFSVGLFANAVLPGRIGEVARVGVLARKEPERRGLWAILIGTVVAHRVFDVFPVVGLIAYVLIAAKIPHWATTSLIVIVAVGFALLTAAIASARSHRRSTLDEFGRVRGLFIRVRHGLGVMHAPLAAGVAVFFQALGWLCQLLAVWAAMRAFDIHAPLPAAALVLLLMNVVTIVPLWPGNFGLLQAAVALPLVQYGVAYGRGFAYGIGLQAIEASVGIGVGLIFLAREGVSYAFLKGMPAAEAEAEAASPRASASPSSAASPTRSTHSARRAGGTPTRSGPST